VDIKEVKLPPYIHATILCGRDVVSGDTNEYVIVWADRAYNTCPQCRQPVHTEVDCPIHLDAGACQGGQLLEYDQQHGCGEWLGVHSANIEPSDSPDDSPEIIEGVTEHAVLAAADKLSAARTADIAVQVATIQRRLRRDLRAALNRLAEPLGADETADDRADEITNGDEIQPGVYHDGGTWLAWDYHPEGSDAITIYQADLHDDDLIGERHEPAQAPTRVEESL
jgi:hypothetical protein